ncbi:syntaxin-52 isoform X1 [Brachypodium distachyon]|nr:syntaxin-52 isoform X1 [Brachypodium distachyon]XP_024317485.1 syntaxin-52 isoform X1 [Brachypodium distachyon]|eukprot:XP_024317484.1 syntaxin-52 isoform X1 [Brachypodium distachyon]
MVHMFEHQLVKIWNLPFVVGSLSTQNVMAAVDFDLRFTYVLAGWEGTAHDVTILADARERENGLYVPQAMATSSDPWMKEYTEASKLVDDISTMIADRGSLPQSGPEIMRHTSAIRRKITILGTRLDSLATLLSRIPPKSLTDKELHKRQDTLSNLKSKAKQMATSFNMSNFANREDLLGQGKKAADDMSRVAGLDNQGIVGLQRQVMKEQDEGLERLEETVLSTKHIALAVNEELTLHTRLIDDLEDHVDVTNSRLQRVQKRLAILNKRTKSGCSCMCLLLSVAAIVVLAVIVWLLIKYL